jgi:hypothetical protein
MGRRRERRPTIVAFDERADVVEIHGYMYYGSSSRNEVGLESTTYDADTDALSVRLTSQDESPLPTACTADMAATWYRVTVRFADSLPETVAVTEGGGRNTETRTVDRAEQRELCTSDHPPDSEAAARAHWTCPEKYVAVPSSSNASARSKR